VRPKLVPTVLTAVLAIACNSDRRAPSARSVDMPDREAFAVYTSVLAVAHPTDGGPSTPIVRRDIDALRPGVCVPDGKAMTGRWRSALDSFKSENAHDRVLPDGAVPEPYDLLTDAQIDALRAREGDQFPRGRTVLDLSAIGFDRSKTRAILHVSYFCGALCAGSRYHLLYKIDGTWSEVILPDIDLCVMVS
jgi:hypothetical protein